MINRAINGTQPLPRTEIVSHTLVAVVEAGTVTRLASWGTVSNPNGWSATDLMGVSGAQQAFAAGLY
jgi:hypothetical protein